MESDSFWQMLFSMSQAAIFFWIFAVGAGFTLFFFLFGEIFDGLEDIFHGIADFLHFDFGDVDVDGGGGPSVFSPRVISVFVAIFGAAGFLASWGKLGPIASSMIGLASGLFVAWVFYLAFSWIYQQQSSSVVNNMQLAGLNGMVKTEIPAEGIGEVIVDYAGSRLTRPARAADSGVIPCNSSVVVKEVLGQTLFVEVRK